MNRLRRSLAVSMSAALMLGALGTTAMAQDAVVAEPGQDIKMMFLPKCLDNEVFVQANDGAQEAAAELGLATPPDFVGPTCSEPASAQIPYMVNAPTQEYDVAMVSNAAGDEMVDAAAAAQEAGITVVTWDSPVTGAEDVFIAQVDFDETGKVMADMALNILGEDGGQFAILSATPEAPNQNAWIAAMEAVLAEDEAYANLELVETVYGNDNIDDSTEVAFGLIDSWPDLELIMAPTTQGIRAAAKVVTDEGLCDTIKISGLGLPSEMKDYTLSGCAPEFALWSFTDLGYLSTYVAYLIATGAINGDVGDTFEAGRMGTYTIEDDPTREGEKRVLMGPFSVYTPENVEDA